MSAPAISRSAEGLLKVEHAVIDHVDWAFYMHLLEAAGDRQKRITYYKGRVEIIAPLAVHESRKKRLSRLIEMMTLELDIPIACFGATTFSRKDKESGLEPDECYYVGNAERVWGMERFDPTVHPAPDLAIEVDIATRSIAREPIYTALGVRELWRYDGSHLTVRVLDGSGKYRTALNSVVFPFLPMKSFEDFVHRLSRDDPTPVLRDFQNWVHGLVRA